uniref:Ig-like domain-containing protein n=1 Tax=Oncorhynchus kisutch TaxID=8019 RepID=A0A8C7GP03_ONCKI
MFMFAGLLLFIPVLLAEDVAVLFCRKKSVCVLEGLSVKLSCGFTIQDTRRKLKEFYWFNNNNRKKWKDTTIPEDLSEDPEYYGRLLHGAVGGFGQYSITTTIINLRPSDSAEYKFRLNTQNSGWKNSESGTTVFVTGLKVIKNPDTVKEGQKVTLTCSTMCILSNNPNLTYIWYKNGRRLTNPKTLKTSLSEDAGSYSCVLVGLENQPSLGATLTVRYPPRSTTVMVSTDQNKIVEGSSVTLTCSSDANPPMEKYTWYKRNGTKVSVLQGETESYTIPIVSLGYIDQYFCEAKNEIGAQNSTWDLTTDDRLVNVLTPVLCVVAVLTAGTLLVLKRLSPLDVRFYPEERITIEPEDLQHQPKNTPCTFFCPAITLACLGCFPHIEL